MRFADLIFPWFLLIVGVAIPFSTASARKKGLSLWRYDLKVLGRVLALVFLGCLIDSSIAKQPLFDLNVLQLIGLAYGVGSLLYALPLPRRIAAAARAAGSSLGSDQVSAGSRHGAGVVYGRGQL